MLIKYTIKSQRDTFPTEHIGQFKDWNAFFDFMDIEAKQGRAVWSLGEVKE